MNYDTVLFIVFVLAAVSLTLSGIALIYLIFPDLEQRDRDLSNPRD